MTRKQYAMLAWLALTICCILASIAIWTGSVSTAGKLSTQAIIPAVYAVIFLVLADRDP